MKTLDEVIKAYEQCAKSDWEEGCGDCAYRNEKCGSCKCVRNDDALHYLRKLKLIRQTPIMQGIHKAQKECALYPVDNWGEDEPDYNPALTWSELQKMEGKPVWVEALLYKQWAIIAYVGVDYIRFEGTNLYAPECRVYMGADNGWQAYRKERNEES